MARTLLFEIGTEEIPSGFIDSAASFMRTYLEEAFGKIKLPCKDIRTFSTPRRLAVMATGIAETLPDMVETKMGPPRNIAFDKEGNPTTDPRQAAIML
ncbi:MAG TPA: glycine--tRNA ligase subunit beta, partial [Deltaproteobacteria bacterium]|nr:glycine--tRNA ligase subunit beta [Deltaproteobacteria bacterium]